MSNLATIVNNILADSGIDDLNVVVTTGSYANPAWITTLSWSKITSTPTTLAGYGITDAVPSTRTITINGVAQDLSVDRSWTIAAGVASVTASGAGITASPTTGAVVISNTGVTSNVAGTGISVSGATGAVTITNTGVTSIVAGTGISISGATGAVTVTNSGVTSVNGSTGAITGIITTSNYNSYSPTLTGTGASGTWGISVTGTAGSETLATITGRGATTSNPITINGGGSQPLSLTTSSGSPWHLALVRTDLGLTSRVFANNSPYNGWYFEHNISIAGNTNIHSGNYTSYSPSLTGAGASGTWGINITGSAGSLSNMNISQFTNDSGYITSSSLSGYLPLSGGQLSGVLYVGTTGSGVYGQYWKDGSGSYIEAVGNSTATRKMRVQSFDGSANYSQWFVDGGNLQIYGSVSGVTNFLFNSSTVYLRYNGSDKFWTGSDGTRNAGWLYMQNGGVGIHYPTYNSHFYMTGGNYWHMNPTGGASYGGLIIYSDYNSTAGGSTYRKGYLYYDTNGFGLLGGGDGDWAINVNASTSKYVTIGGHSSLQAYSAVTGVRLMFGGGDGDAQANYYIGTNLENYGGNYNKLDLRWHTGIRMGAQPGYGGIRFFDTEDLGTKIFSIGEGDANVRVTNTLYIGGNVAATQSWVTSQGYVTGGPFVQNVLGDSGAFNLNVSGQQAFFRFSTGSWVNSPVAGNYSHVLSVNGASDNRTVQIYLGDVPGYLWWRPNQGGTWHPWERILTSNNYNGWAPTLTGGGASGTWSINITGNADTVDGYHASTSTIGNYIVVRDGSGYIFGNYINMTDDGNPGGGTAITSFITKQGDNYYRSVSPTNAMSSIRGVASGTWGINVTGSAGSLSNMNISQFTNNSGYITSSSLGAYLPLAGGTMTGAITTPTGTSIYIGGQNVSTSSRLIINWHTDSDYNYLIGKRAGSWTQPMDITFYTGLRYHAHQSYNGHIFYVAGYDNTEAFSIGKGDSNVRVNNILYVSGDVRAPVYYDSANTSYYLDPNATGTSLNVAGRMVGTAWTTTARNYSNEWIEFPNHSGLYSPLNGAHFYPNNADYGGWRMSGTRNGWNGMTIDATNGHIALMVNPSSNQTGFHNQNYGWQFFWSSGILYVYKNAYGGGTQATVLDSSNAPYAWNMNQYVRTSDSVTFTNVYNYGWFRNYNNLEGLYSQPNGIHFYASNSTDWNITGSGGGVSLVFRANHQSTIRGYVHSDTSSNFGLLNNQGGWSVRCYAGTGYGGALTGSWTASGDLIAYSDERVKTNISTIDNALNKVLSLRGVTYERTDGLDQSQKIGVIAQEVQKILPQVVHEQQDGMLGVSYGNMVGVLIEAIKEQQKQIEELKSKLDGTPQ